MAVDDHEHPGKTICLTTGRYVWLIPILFLFLFLLYTRTRNLIYMTDSEMLILTEGIRKKYESYRLAKPGKYPVLKFNSYPVPYEHLRKSFQEELSSHGQADMQEAIAAIPSTKVFAKVFHEGYILKDEKVINACYLYAWGKPRNITTETARPHIVPEEPQPATIPTDKPFIGRVSRRNLLVAALVSGAGLLAYAAVKYYRSTLSPSGLVITSPTSGMTVPRIMIAQGKVAHAELVWLVIRNPKHPEYYVQDPAMVSDDGTWRVPIYTGNSDKSSIGVRFQIRAFVNPVKPLLEGQMIYAWPEAELSSGIVDVIRGPQDIQALTP
ncbi:hypothetical protein J2I47_08825 [Fibrella sp. HMF5335]|uniref:Transmembrane protein n=1 Tax=Fibrella rubiginis TaxID=2817060 RepID=A0A939GG77_9BACT|nr:hypothetical protein [Fibrella rubiginis]MBO0936644.1 hypothetical protein [Fibrella rubiginis]